MRRRALIIKTGGFLMWLDLVFVKLRASGRGEVSLAGSLMLFLRLNV